VPSSTPQGGKHVDHRAAAEDKTRYLIDEGGDVRNPGAVAYALCAQAEASLAIADEIRQFRELMGRSYS
jgi:hypothetical protein